MNFRQTIRGILMSLVLGAGLLALVQMDTPVDNEQQVWHKSVRPQRTPWRKIYDVAATVTGKKSAADRIAEDLHEVMEQDELGGINPFDNLSANDSLNRVFSRGIQNFERQTLRSPSYKEESGYDLVHYEITHPDGSVSSILAFLEQPVESSKSGVPEVREETAMVMILTPKDGQQEYALFKNGALEEINLLMPEEGSALFAQRLQAGIPFLSVSR